MRPHSEPITFGERLATATLSAIASAFTLACYFLVNLAFASKSPSGSPGWLFELFLSKISLALIAASALLGFVLGAERMSNVLSVFWGTSELWNEAWFNKVMACVVVAILVLVIAHLAHGSRT